MLFLASCSPKPGAHKIARVPQCAPPRMEPLHSWAQRHFLRGADTRVAIATRHCWLTDTRDTPVLGASRLMRVVGQCPISVLGCEPVRSFRFSFGFLISSL